MDDFVHRSCTLCYAFITQNAKPLTPHPMTMQSLIAKNASDTIALSGPVVPDPRNESTLETVCGTLSEEMCGRWVRGRKEGEGMGGGWRKRGEIDER